ncbi:MAG: glycosyltransferase family 39 protein, partial [bacterium]|nr:glycosyltransferase family 39 protein [bacterium]
MFRTFVSWITENYILAGILALTLFLSSAGIFFYFGNPYAVGDESVLTAAALNMLAEPSLVPASPFNYHMPLAAYLYVPAIAFVLGVLLFFGAFTSIEEIVAFGAVEWGQLIMVGRFLSVALAILCVYLVYRITQEMFAKRTVSLIASYVVATHVLFVNLAHTGKVWIPQLTIILLSIWLIVRLMHTSAPRVRHYVGIGISLAAALGTHFIGILAYVPFVVSLYLNDKEKGVMGVLRNRGFWIVNGILLLSLPVLYVMNPYGFTNYFGRGVQAAVALVAGGGAVDISPEGWSNKIWYYPRVLWDYQPILTFLFVPSLLLFFKRQRTWFWLVSSFVFVYYFVIGPLVGGSTLRLEPRFILPVIPFMAIVVAYAYIDVCERSKDVWRRVLRVGLAVFLLFSLITPVLWDWRMMGPYTEEEALHWIEGAIPNNSRLAMFTYAGPIPLNENAESLRVLKETNPDFFSTSRAFLLENDDVLQSRQPHYFAPPLSYYLRKEMPEALVDQDFDYIITTWNHVGQRVLIEKQMEEMGLLFENAELIAAFPGGASEESNAVSIIGWLTHPIRTLLRTPMH